MTVGRTHSLRSFVFSHSINIADIAANLNVSESSIDPRASLSRKVDPEGHVFIFNSGSAVFWDVPADRQQLELKRIVDLEAVPDLKPRFTDTFNVEIKPGPAHMEFNLLVIDHLNLDRMEVIASTLAQSTSMEYYESLVEEAWEQVNKLLREMSVKGNLSIRSTLINRRIGEALSLRSSVVRVLHLLDKPDLIWEDKVMDGIYGDLRAMFDLPERFQALEYKLQLIQQTLEVVVEMVRDRRLYWLEMAVVVLILFEILMTLVRTSGLP